MSDDFRALLRRHRERRRWSREYPFLGVLTCQMVQLTERNSDALAVLKTPQGVTWKELAPMPNQYTPRPPLSERFLSKVDKTAGPDGCHVWTGSTNDEGYGQIRTPRPEHRIIYTHRLAWELAYGPIPDGLCVLHNCPGGDNPSCVNIRHLFLGTLSDNTQDMLTKARGKQQFTSETTPQTKLTPDMVRAMRRLRAESLVTYREIGERFGVASNTARYVVTGRRWKDVK